MTLTLTLDDTTRLLVDRLREDLAAEPPRPDHDVHSGHELEEVARRHDSWDRTIGAWRLLIGVRLVNLALSEEP